MKRIIAVIRQEKFESVKKALIDAKIFVSDVAEVIRIRTGERGSDAV